MNLAEAPIGSALRIDEVEGEAAARLRLAELGLRPGEVVEVSHRTAGGGRVVKVDHCRIALDRATLSSIAVADAVAQVGTAPASPDRPSTGVEGN